MYRMFVESITNKLKQSDMKNLEKQMIEATEQYGVKLKKSLVTYGTIILYCFSISDVKKLSSVLNNLDAKIVTNEYDLTVGIVF